MKELLLTPCAPRERRLRTSWDSAVLELSSLFPMRLVLLFTVKVMNRGCTAIKPPVSTADAERRAKLKVFLMNCRSRLKPEDVGFPSTPRRRVSGLRREEVAELLGVSEDWYRWFESGRAIRVSASFLAKLCKVLRLDPIEIISLYYLALPEIYEAYVAQRSFVIPVITAQAS